MGSGYGWKTLENLAGDLDIPIQDMMAYLKSIGIDAEKNGMKANELVKLIQKLKE